MRVIARSLYFVYLASVGVFFRDISQIMPLLSTLVLFTSPTLFPRESMPTMVGGIIAFNPITLPIEHLRQITLLGQLPIISEFITSLSIALVTLYMGWLFFQKTRKGFADVL